jgi:hypothetical protein
MIPELFQFETQSTTMRKITPPVFHQDFEPRAGALLRKVDAAEAEARNHMTESIGRWRVGNLSNRAPGILRTISMGPSVLDFLMHLRNGHF